MPLIFKDFIKPDCHINAIGSHTPAMHEVDVSVLQQATNIVDQRSAVMIEAGEIIKAVNEKHIQENDLIELGDAVLAPADYAKYKSQLTVFKSVGLAIQDIAIAHKVLELAKAKQVGTQIAF